MLKLVAVRAAVAACMVVALVLVGARPGGAVIVGLGLGLGILIVDAPQFAQRRRRSASGGSESQ
jgi:hypothetical protein